MLIYVIISYSQTCWLFLVPIYLENIREKAFAFLQNRKTNLYIIYIIIIINILLTRVSHEQFFFSIILNDVIFVQIFLFQARVTHTYRHLKQDFARKLHCFRVVGKNLVVASWPIPYFQGHFNGLQWSFNVEFYAILRCQ